MNQRRWGFAGGLCLLLGLALAGCELDGETVDATVDVSGTWLYSDTEGRQSTWALAQSDDDRVTGAGTDAESIRGSVSSDTVALTLTYAAGADAADAGSTSTLNGTVTGSTMSGNFTNSASGAGSWAAVKTN